MDLKEVIEQERARLETRKTELETELDEVNRELKAVEAYDKAKNGTSAPIRTGTRRTGIRNDVLQLIHEHEDGLARADILEKMDAKGDKKAEQSISNALAALKKAEAITADDGVYTVTG